MDPLPTATSTTVPPTTIGPYRVEREIARGGMGIVYLARDTRLERSAAIKALPDEVAADPDRLSRFEREAKVLASLNHPNIAGIYGVEESGGRRYLALELVEGETLAERIARGPIPLGEAVDVCVQIAAGVEAAHEGGVIHRDLKPVNVMITPGDVVKVLDFGLAKGRVAESDSHVVQSPTFPNSPTVAASPTFSQSPTLSHSPTLISPATMPGVILGTAAYLSPEQARGKAVDRRADIWSFGCVLYECLTGRLAFEGETVSDTIAKILEREVDWARLPKSTPPRVRELLQRCLEKDPKRRLRDIGDARLALEVARAGRAAVTAGADAAGQAAPSRTRLPRLATVLAFLLGFTVAAAAWNLFRVGVPWDGSGDRAVTVLSITLPEEIESQASRLSPDGRTLTTLAVKRNVPPGQEARSQIYARRMDATAFQPLRGTEGAAGTGAVSPDGKWIAFIAPVNERSTKRRILKMPIDQSAPPVPVIDLQDDWTGRPIWLRSDEMLVTARGGRQYVRVSMSGKASTKPKDFDSPELAAEFSFQQALPLDRGVLLGATYYEGGNYRQGVAVLDLRSGKVKTLIQDGGNARYSPTGHLVFTRNQTLLAAPFHSGKLALTGEPMAIRDGLRVASSWSNAGFDLAENGTLLYPPGGDVGKSRVGVMVDAKNAVVEWSGERQPFESSLDVSEDGNRLAVVIANAGALYEIWISDRGRPASRRVVTVPGVDCATPVWSPDGARLAYSQTAQSSEDGVHVVRVDGSSSPERVTTSPSPQSFVIPTSWSPDGSQLLISWTRPSGPAIGAVPVASGASAAPLKALFDDATSRWGAKFSPDGRMIAFTSDESGKAEIYVCAWSQGGPLGQPLVVSTGGGQTPFWSPDGKRLYYGTSTGGRIMQVALDTQPYLSASAPIPAWDLDALRIIADGLLLDILPDGRLFGIRKGEGEDEVTRYDVVLNFSEELKQRFKAAR